MTARSASLPAKPWTVTSRTIVFGAVGAALYGALGVFSVIFPGTANVAIRPALAIIPFVGIRFGPIAGFFTGVVGKQSSTRSRVSDSSPTGTGPWPTALWVSSRGCWPTTRPSRSRNRDDSSAWR